MGDSLTEGDGNPSAYRYALFEKLFSAGADFRYVGPSSSRDDVRLPALYNKHGGNCGYVIGDDSDEGGGSLRKNLRNEYYASTLKGADIVLLWIGANDFGQKLDLEHICDRYTDLLCEIWKLAPSATVYGALMLDTYSGTDILDGWLTDVAPAKFGAMGHRFVPVKLDRENRKLSFADGDFHDEDGHPTEHGNEKLACSWFDAIIGEVEQLNAEGENDGTEPLVRACKIELEEKNATIPLGGSVTLHASVIPADASVKTVLWKSSNESIARVDRYGRVFPISLGEVDITAQTLDGVHVSVAHIKVAGMQDLTLGYKKLFSSDLTNADKWDGATDQIKSRYNKFQVCYKGEPNEIAARDFCFSGDRLLLSFVHRTANHGGRSRDNYSSVRLGRYELRICALASVTELYDDGKLVGEYVGVPISGLDDRYALEVKNSCATVYRNGEVLFEAHVGKVERDGALTLHWNELYAKSEIKSVEVYGE